MYTRTLRLLALSTATVLLLAACGAEQSASAPQPDQQASDGGTFEGEIITLVVPYGPGGGYDT